MTEVKWMLWKVQNFFDSQKANNAQKNAANEDESRCANGIKLKWHQSEIMVQLNEAQAGNSTTGKAVPKRIGKTIATTLNTL